LFVSNQNSITETPDNTKQQPKKERRKKYVDLKDLPQDIKTIIDEQKQKEADLLQQSGYKKLKFEFLSVYMSYSTLFFYFQIKPIGVINNKHLAALVIPIIPIGYLLIKKNLNVEKYSEYRKAHLEMNKLISKYIYKKEV
jgi:hypothetical protein